MGTICQSKPRPLKVHPLQATEASHDHLEFPASGCATDCIRQASSNDPGVLQLPALPPRSLMGEGNRVCLLPNVFLRTSVMQLVTLLLSLISTSPVLLPNGSRLTCGTVHLKTSLSVLRRTNPLLIDVRFSFEPHQPGFRRRSFRQVEPLVRPHGACARVMLRPVSPIL